MKKHQFFDNDRNYDSFFLLSNDKENFFDNLTKVISNYAIQLKVNLSVQPKKVGDFEILNFKGVNEAEVVCTKDHCVIVWKNITIDMPMTLQDCQQKVTDNDIDAFIFLDLQNKTMSWANSFLSKQNLFYSFKDGAISLFNDLDLFFGDKEMASDAEEIFSTLGWVPPEMPLFDDLKVTDFSKLHTYCFTNKTVTQTKLNSFFDSFSDNYMPYNMDRVFEFYSLFKSVVRRLPGPFYTLTGGCDTRLIFSCIKDKAKKIYWTDCTVKRQDIFFDKSIVEKILLDHNLKGFVFDTSRSFMYSAINLSESELDTVRAKYSGQHKSVSGMFGGEIVGAGYIDQVNGAEILIGKPFKEKFKNLVRKYPHILKSYFFSANGPKKQILFMRAFYKTVMSDFYYPHNLWQRPYKHTRTQSQKPFLNKDVLKFMAHMLPNKVYGHLFYREIFLKRLPELAKYPVQNLVMTQHKDFKKPGDVFELPLEFANKKVKQQGHLHRKYIVERTKAPYMAN